MKKEHKLLLAIFIITLAIRLFFAFQTPFFSHEAYFNLRQIEYITQHGIPFFHDELSYGGRDFIFPPLFHYILAFFNLFLPLEIVAKVLPNLFASSLIFPVYLISKKLTKDSEASLFSAFIAAFIPVFSSKTVNSVSVYSLLFPLMFYAIYCLMNISEEKYITYFIIIIFLLPLVHQLSFLFLLGMLVYLLLATGEKIAILKAELEAILFSVFIIFWVQFLIYKQAFLLQGPAIIWQNIPQEILGNYFSELTILEGIYQIGVIPFIFGIFIIYQYIFRKKNRDTYILFGFALAAGSMLLFRLIPVGPGLMFFGIILAILFSHFYAAFSVYLHKTKAEKFTNYIAALFLIAFIITSATPSLLYSSEEIRNALSQEEVDAMNWLRENARQDLLIASSLEDSFAIQAIAQRKTLMDSNFFLIENIDQRYSDFEGIFTTHYETDAVRLSNKYHVGYIYFSDNAKKEFQIQKLDYSENKNCFDLVYDTVNIYKVLCEVEER